MITLKTLPEATAQEVFDQVATHLLTQMQRSISMGKCKYRNSTGLKCAAGCLIADDEYDYEIEGTSWEHLDVPQNHVKLIQKLQEIHDYNMPYEWKTELEKLAYTEGLFCPKVLFNKDQKEG